MIYCLSKYSTTITAFKDTLGANNTYAYGKKEMPVQSSPLNNC